MSEKFKEIVEENKRQHQPIFGYSGAAITIAAMAGILRQFGVPDIYLLGGVPSLPVLYGIAKIIHVKLHHYGDEFQNRYNDEYAAQVHEEYRRQDQESNDRQRHRRPGRRRKSKA